MLKQIKLHIEDLLILNLKISKKYKNIRHNKYKGFNKKEEYMVNLFKKII